MAIESQQAGPNIISLSKTIPNKPCYGLDCSNIGTHILLIKFINRIGFFCDNCKNGLKSSNLIKHDFSSPQEIGSE